ncbi:MAG: amidohydrolase family protein [Pseudomonadales bacterium]|jgi:imidazolonepropionase-like amidohydrolase|nr:amidohydrolase family protein [Pseudomonadales bacterium]MCP5337841.1 amidohydrolase family protein [Pseudomonadales bacterium]
MRVGAERLLKMLCAAVCLSVGMAWAQAAPPAAVVFENVRIFDGTSSALSEPSNVLVRGNRIESISRQPFAASDAAGALRIAGNGRTLMPGLIDAHYHLMMAGMTMPVLMSADVGYLNLLVARTARELLLRGFTSIRDMAGPSFSIKRAIDQGLVDGPRIWPSGAMISQTGGHGDFRMPYEVPAVTGAPLSRSEVLNMGAIADSPDEVRKKTREQLMLGASQIKLAAGGGVASLYDPLDVSQFSEAEIRAAVEAAENWGTYVTVHAYTPRAIRTAIAAGVKSIEHGQLMDEPTARLIAEKGVWLNLQAFLDNEFANPFPEGSPQRAKQLQMFTGTDNAFNLARKYRVKLAWGTDILLDPRLTDRPGAILATMTRWFTPAEALRIATSSNAELLQLSGPRSPYPGKLGVVAEGALADLLLVDGNPLEDIGLIADPAKNFVVIMKDGKIYKDATQ